MNQAADAQSRRLRAPLEAHAQRIAERARRLLAASIDPSRRGETLGVADFVRLLQRSDDSEERVRLV